MWPKYIKSVRCGSFRMFYSGEDAKIPACHLENHFLGQLNSYKIFWRTNSKLLRPWQVFCTCFFPIQTHTWKHRELLFSKWENWAVVWMNGINYLFHNYPLKGELELILTTDVSSSFIINQIDCQSAFWKTFSLPPPPAPENKLLLWP